MDGRFIRSINSLEMQVSTNMDQLYVSDAITEIFNVLRLSNKYIDETTPWVLAKDESKKERLETVLYNLLESIRVCAVLLSPFLPETSENILNQIQQHSDETLYVDNHIYELGKPSPLFMRIDVSKE